MPELPEVETVRRGLAETILGRRVVLVRVHHPAPLRPDPATLTAGVIGRQFVAARRSGKHLFLDLDGGATLTAHLRMTGQFRLAPADAERLPHTHLELVLDDQRALRWRDVRRFGWLHLTATEAVGDLPSLTGVGPDALIIDREGFRARLGGVRRQMKALLLAQDLVCGLGNIYADEVLWQARIHPRQLSDRLSGRRLDRLYDAMRMVLLSAIEHRGSSIDGQYVSVDGLRGGYQSQHAVYGRAGLPAPCCGKPVSRTVVNSRSTFYCPRCQRKR